jgi:hypothetical protein
MFHDHPVVDYCSIYLLENVAATWIICVPDFNVIRVLVAPCFF